MTDDQESLDALETALADALAAVADQAGDVAALGRAAFARHDVPGLDPLDRLDEDLAELTFDSRLAPAGTLRELAGPGAAGPRVMVFHAAGLSVELEIDAEQILGQLVPPGPGMVTFEAPSGPLVRAVADEFGFFALPAPPPQPLQMRCTAAAAVLRTDWFLP